MPPPVWTQSKWFYKDGVLRETARAFLQEIFLEQVQVVPESDCWWFVPGKPNRGGYKTFMWGGRHELAHRFAYKLWKGEIPTGLNVLHSCDTPPCCNPDHLRVGTDMDNMQDRLARGKYHTDNNVQRAKTHCPQGHEYTPETTYFFENRRYCKPCHKQHSAAHARKLQAENPERKREQLRQWRASKRTP